MNATTLVNASLIAINPLWANIVAACCIGVPALFGFVTYSIVVIIILRHPETFTNTLFYGLVLSLAICEMIELGPYLLFYLAPCILLQERLLGDTFDKMYGAITCIMCYFVSLYITILIALNRYYAVCRFASYGRVFSKSRTRLYLVIAWTLGIISGAVMMLPGFGYITWPELYVAGFDSQAWGIPYYNNYDRCADFLGFVVQIFCYSAILIKRPTKMVGNTNLSEIERNRREKAERRLALQFGIIAIVFVAYQIGFQTLYHIPVDNPFFYLSELMLYIMFTSCNAYVYLFFNSDVRSHFLKIFCKSMQSSSAVVTLASQQNENK